MAENEIVKNNQESKNQFLTFSLSDEVFGVSILQVKEIIEYGGVTPIPMMPEFIKGVINLRGLAVPVVDLASRLGRPSGEITRKTCIIIVEIQGGGELVEIGLMVDGVDEVLALSSDQLEPPPKFGASIRTDFIEGMGKIDDNFVVLLQPNNILSGEEISMIEGASEQGQQIIEK